MQVYLFIRFTWNGLKNRPPLSYAYIYNQFLDNKGKYFENPPKVAHKNDFDRLITLACLAHPEELKKVPLAVGTSVRWLQ